MIQSPSPLRTGGRLTQEYPSAFPAALRWTRINGGAYWSSRWMISTSLRC